MATREASVEHYLLARTVTNENGCWVWSLSLNSRGYGMCQRRDWRGLAHRFAYTHLVGEIPEGLEVDHLCANKACVNPDHLELVSAKENAQRERFARFGRNYTVFHQANGLWCAAVEVGPPGERRRKRFRSKTRQTAVARIEGWLSKSQ